MEPGWQTSLKNFVDSSVRYGSARTLGWGFQRQQVSRPQRHQSPFFLNELRVGRCTDGFFLFVFRKSVVRASNGLSDILINAFFLYSHFLRVSLKFLRVADVRTDFTSTLLINFTFCQEVNSDQRKNDHWFSTTRFLSRYLPLSCVSSRKQVVTWIIMISVLIVLWC
jgi:hypothetical protein